MSISDMIVVMKQGILQQIGRPQEVYDDPGNLFVAKFLGTPPINVFEGKVKGGVLTVGEDAVLKLADTADRDVWVGVRPEGFVLREDGPLQCGLIGVEVMGRDTSVVASHPACASATLRAIISAENRVDSASGAVRFDLKPNKLFLFDRQTEERVPFRVQ